MGHFPKILLQVFFFIILKKKIPKLTQIWILKQLFHFLYVIYRCLWSLPHCGFTLRGVQKLCRLKIGDFWPPPPLVVFFWLNRTYLVNRLCAITLKYCTYTNHVGVSPRALYCVVETSYGLGRSLWNCRPALPKGRKYQMVKTQTQSHVRRPVVWTNRWQIWVFFSF